MGGTSPASKHLQARQRRGVFFPLLCEGGAGMRQGCGPSSRREDVAGSGIKFSEHGAEAQRFCPPTNPSLLPACSFQRWQWDAGAAEGTPHCLRGGEAWDEQENASVERRCQMRIHSCQLTVGRLERSHVPGQAVVPMGPPPEDSQPPAVPPGDPLKRGVTARGAETPPTERRSCGTFAFFSSPLPSGNHLPNSHPPTPASRAVRKEKNPKGDSPGPIPIWAPCSTAPGWPGTLWSPRLQNQSKAKAVSPSSQLPRDRNRIRTQSGSFHREIYTGGRSRIGYLMIVVLFFFFI